MKQTILNFFVLFCILAIVVSSKTVPTRLERSTDTCGVPKTTSGLIVYGRNITRGDFPWIVALMNTVNETAKCFCGATLISSTFVISAAHCILQKGSNDVLLAQNVIALFGAHKLFGYSEPGRFALSPKKITIHEDWNSGTTQYDADISLLEFEKGRIQFNNYVQPICLWDDLREGTSFPEAIVAGWGKTVHPIKEHENEPTFIGVPIQSNGQCLPGQGGLAALSSERTFCAGLKNGSGVCFGDSGGGLIVEVNGVYHLKGIVSASLFDRVGFCDVLHNAIYTNVLKFRGWIAEVTGAAS